MNPIIHLILIVISIGVHSSEAGCPKATFDFRNQTTRASYNFIDSTIGNIGSLETCPYTGRPYVYLPCYPNSSWGDTPYFSNCIKPVDLPEQTKMIRFGDTLFPNVSIEQITQLPMLTSIDVSNILSYLNEDLSSKLISSSEIVSIVNLFDRLMMNNQNIEEIQSNLYSIANKLLELPMQEAQKINRSIVKLCSLLESNAQTFLFNGSEKSFSNPNLAVSIVQQLNNRTEPIIGFVFDASKDDVKAISSNDDLANSSFITLNTEGQHRLTFSRYSEKNDLFDDGEYHVITPVIALTVDQPALIKRDGSFVKIHFQLENDLPTKNRRLFCAYWNILENLTAHWSTEGCRLSNRTEQSVTCSCNHLTHFAVVMDMEQKSTPRLVEQILSIITLVGLLLSSTGLCLTILTFILFKKLRRHFSQKSLVFLSINLLCVNIFFSLICFSTLKQIICTIIASLLHYFILSSFGWMFIMAVIQYLIFAQVFPSSVPAFTRKAATFAQLVPLIPVIIVLALDPKTYTKRTDHICWLSSLPFYLAFILPIVLYMIGTSTLFLIVTYSLVCGKRREQLRHTQVAESQRLSRLSIAFGCFISLSLTWIFSLLIMGSIHLLVQSLFCIFASLTGLLVFILYLITSKTKRSSWNGTFKSLGISSIYSPTSSSSSGYLGNKDYSTTSISDHQKVPSRRLQFPTQSQHFIDAYMPSSPPPPAPPLLPPPQPSLLIEGDDPLCRTDMTSHFFEPRHVWAPQTNFIYETNQATTSIDDYSLFYASNHDATKL